MNHLYSRKLAEALCDRADCLFSEVADGTGPGDLRKIQVLADAHADETGHPVTTTWQQSVRTGAAKEAVAGG